MKKLIIACCLIGMVFSKMTMCQNNGGESWQFKSNHLLVSAGIMMNINVSASADDNITVSLNGTVNAVTGCSVNWVNDTVRIIEEEKEHRDNRPSTGSPCTWDVTIPAGTSVGINGSGTTARFSGIEGNITVNCGIVNLALAGCSGKVTATSGAGSVILQDCNGKFNLRGGTTRYRVDNCSGIFYLISDGNIDCDNIKLTGEGWFSSGSGHAIITLSEIPRNNLTVNSSFSKAVVDFNGLSVAGNIEFICETEGGRISSPYKLGQAETFRAERSRRELGNDGPNLTDYTKRSFIRGDSKPKITIRTATGIAVLKK